MMNNSRCLGAIVKQDNKCIRKELADYWNWRASSFDETSAQQGRWWDVYLAAAKGGKNCKILDVGTGTGFIAMGLANAGHKVTGVDIAPGMLKKAQKKACLSGLEIDFVLAEAEKPPFPDKSFDLIVCRNLLWTLCDPQKTLQHWHKLLRPNGRIIVSDGIWRESGLKSFFLKIKNYVGGVFKKGMDFYPARFEAAYRTLNKYLPHFNGIKAFEAESLLKKSGFKNVCRYDHLFLSNPYPKTYGNEFFVMAATKAMEITH
ncbi:MAG: class I SAM-dependent methyltransferase [Desulfobacteraceae bacterium]|nr:class I SAM-dependent methyltransferase [Desulfobacteraceae bacterium]